MRIWDVHPGYLSAQSLVAEHRDIHGSLTVLRASDETYADDEEVARWRGHAGALRQRHDVVVAELDLRGFRHDTAAPQEGPPGEWPVEYVEPPAQQLRTLAALQSDRDPGRLPVPRSAQELWAQHKYSVMARDPQEGRNLGKRVAELRSGDGLPVLAAELVEVLRDPPRNGNRRNAIEHMWGYVSEFAPEETRGRIQEILEQQPTQVLQLIAHLARQHKTEYLLHSTALSDLAAW